MEVSPGEDITVAKHINRHDISLKINSNTALQQSILKWPFTLMLYN